MKIKTFVLSIFILFTVSLLNAQETKPTFLNKTNQQSVSAEFVAISYSYAHKFKQNATFGARVQVGFGGRYLLTNPSFYYSCGQCTGGPVLTKVRDAIGSVSYVMGKLQLFYRLTISNQFYYDIGPYIALGAFDERVSNEFNAGLEGTAYYHIWKIHVGSSILAGFQFTTSNGDYFGLYVIPIVIGFNF